MDEDILNVIDPRIIGKRLQEARKARSMTQQAVADMIQTARTTITAIEKGERRVRAHEMVRLAELYGRSVNELIKKYEVSDDITSQFRAILLRGGEKEDEIQKISDEFKGICSDYVELEQITSSPMPRMYPPIYKVDGISSERIGEDIAMAERNRLGLGDGPIPNLRELLENYVGLRIFYMQLPSKMAGIFSYSDKLGGCIAINIKHPEERRRWSQAHEYGHFLVDRYKLDISYLFHQKRVPGKERFADAFAKYFLMPSASLSRRFNDFYRSKDGEITPADICTLANFYSVSFEALTIRLEELKLIQSGTWDYLKESGFKVQEAKNIMGLTASPAYDQKLPMRFLYLAAKAYGRGDLSEGQFARFLRLSRVEARRLYGYLMNRLSITENGDIGYLSIDILEQNIIAKRSSVANI